MEIQLLNAYKLANNSYKKLQNNIKEFATSNNTLKTGVLLRDSLIEYKVDTYKMLHSLNIILQAINA